MRFLSRFKKGQAEDDAVEALEAGEEEGLLMATEGRPRASTEDETAAQAEDLDSQDTPGGAAVAADSAGTDQPQAEGGDLRATPGGEAASDTANASEPAGLPVDAPAASAEEQPDPTAQATEGESGPGESVADPDDDPLAAFRGAVVESDESYLTKGIEDVPIADLVAEVREVRNMLPPTPPESEHVEG